jgi:CSLREA domain-containing protein
MLPLTESLKCGDLTITNSKIANNSATEGGGIFTSYSNSSLTITNSIISGDPAVMSTYGGAIMNGGSILTITNSTFSNNFTTNRGGAIYNDGPTSNVNIITNSTFSGNTSSANVGGAVYNNATLTITNSTFSGNSGASSVGAAINNAVSKTLNLYNTIIANSTGDKDCYSDGTINASNNLIENGTTYACGLTNNVDGNIIGQDPALNALTDNGGTTETFALQLSSPALNTGNNTICDDNPGPNNLDQRGVTRPENSCDIGAFESNAQPGPTFVVNTDEDSNDGFCDDYLADITDCTLREAINYANSIGGTDTITFSNDYTFTLGSQLPEVTSTIIIDGEGPANTIIQAGATQNTANWRVFSVGSGGNLTLSQVTVRYGVCDGGCEGPNTIGGGIYVSSGALTINNSVVTANNSDDGGAGLYSGVGSLVTITKSTFSENSSSGAGTAIVNQASMTISNSTITNNISTTSYAGGIRNVGITATLDIYNSTVSGNTSNSLASDAANIVHESGALNINNTIIANAINGGDCAINGGTVTVTNSLIESTGPLACNNLANGANGNIIGSDPNLGTLTGSPAYFPLNTGSPAMGTGSNSICAATPVNNQSQNGVTRPQGAQCDIGAFEYVYPILTTTLKSVNTNDGWILESTETSGAGGTLNSATTTFNLGDDAANKQYRTILHFDTSSLPDTAVITSATLKIKKQGIMGTDPFTILGDLKASVRKPAFGAATLALSDFKSAPGKNNVATFSNTPVSNWYSALVNNTGRVYINRTGTTQFRLAFTIDDNNDNGVDLMKFYSGNAGAAARPQLIIQYYIP